MKVPGGALMYRQEKKADELMRQTKGLRTEILGQGTAAIKGQNIAAQIPSIQRAIESQKSATSGAIRSIESQKGLAGTPFGQRAAVEARQRGALAQSQTTTDMAQQAIQRGLGVTQLQTGAAGSLFGQVANLQQMLTQGELAKIGLAQSGFGKLGGK